MVRQLHNLGDLAWTLAGWTPYVWRQQRSIESGVSNNAEVPAIPAQVPGSVQGALLAAGVLPDWNVALQARDCEWVENRHWIYTARLPDAWVHEAPSLRLQALGLDYRGWFLLNGKEIGRFRGSLVPHTLDLTPHLRPANNVVQIVFDCPPRWLGQIGYTTQMREWKPRFNYFWDWTSRLVQIGIWDDLCLEVSDGEQIVSLDVRTGADVARDAGTLQVAGTVMGMSGTHVRVVLERGGQEILRRNLRRGQFEDGFLWQGLPVERWWPNLEGEQPLYTLRCRLLDDAGTVLDEITRRIGFTSIAWQRCQDAPPEADPWICVVNGRPIFLQGVNWTPIRPNFADVTAADYRRRLAVYRTLGCNMIRVWGGAFLEKEVLYDLCDELGILVWQEFPLSSSGLDNYPPDDEVAIAELAEIATSYVQRRRHHVSLAVWCGGNELQGRDGVPLDTSHPLLARLERVVQDYDPERRFLPTSPSGPSFSAEEARFGRGLHWDVHGPWRPEGDLRAGWTTFWENNDGLFHSEVGAPGASSAELIRAYQGDLPEVPGTSANPLWRRTAWWIEWPEFVAEQGREPGSLEEYVVWSQERQMKALVIAAGTSKARFPRCGGFLLWMGHDSFPCTANTSILDFHGNLKPAAVALGEIFRDGATAPLAKAP